MLQITRNDPKLNPDYRSGQSKSQTNGTREPPGAGAEISKAAQQTAKWDGQPGIRARITGPTCMYHVSRKCRHLNKLFYRLDFSNDTDIDKV